MASQSGDAIECVENKRCESITWVYPRVPELYKAILNLVGEHKEKLNFHDALIALVSKEIGIGYIVSFDKDFDEIEWLKRVEYEG